MLDFYLWRDEDEFSEESHPPMASFLGGLGMREFQHLDSLWKRAANIGITLPFFDDSRVTKSKNSCDCCPKTSKS